MSLERIERYGALVELWSWISRVGRWRYGRGVGDPAGVSVDRRALIEINLDKRSADETEPERKSDPEDFAAGS